MNRCLLALAIGLSMQAQVRANELTDRRLAELLRPGISFSMLPGQPQVFAERKPLLPGSVPEKFQGLPPRPQFAAAKPVRPHDPDEPAALELVVLVKPAAAEEIVFATVPVVAVPVIDVDVPPTLPNLARPTPDRVPLTDATLEASIAAALKMAIPLRSVTVPFVPLNLPDPFELQDLNRIRKPLDEDFQPMAVPPQILVRPIEQPVKK
jgi:hypothetical protein